MGNSLRHVETVSSSGGDFESDPFAVIPERVAFITARSRLASRLVE